MLRADVDITCVRPCVQYSIRAAKLDSNIRTYATPPSQKSDFLIRALLPGNAGCVKVVNWLDSMDDSSNVPLCPDTNFACWTCANAVVKTLRATKALRHLASLKSMTDGINFEHLHYCVDDMRVYIDQETEFAAAALHDGGSWVHMLNALAGTSKPVRRNLCLKVISE